MNSLMLFVLLKELGELSLFLYSFLVHRLKSEALVFVMNAMSAREM